MIAELRPLTRDDLLTVPDDGNRYEIINGELVATPAPLVRHQRVLLRLTRLLDSFLLEGGAGEIFIAPLDVVLGPNDVVEPDLLAIASEQGRVRGTENSFAGPPVLVVEIISPSSQRTDLIKKMALYAGRECRSTGQLIRNARSSLFGFSRAVRISRLCLTLRVGLLRLH